MQETMRWKRVIKMKNKKHKGLKQRKALAGYLFISPFIIGFLIFMVQPLFQSFYMSLCTVTVSANGFSLETNHFANFVKAFTVDPEFNRMLVTELKKMLINSLATMVFSFFVALMLNQKFKGRAFVRAVFFLPVILSSGVLVGLEYNNTLLSGMQDVIQKSMSSNITSIVEEILDNLNFGGNVVSTVLDVVNKVYDIAIASGIQIIIFLSGLQTITQSMYEAAEIEGCTKWESLWKITFPMISSLILVNWIYTIIDFFMKTDNQVMEKISKVMIKDMNYGFSSAMAWIYFGITILVISISSLIISKGVYYYE